MITTHEEYLSNLIQISDKNKPQIAILLPQNESIYEINLNSREITVPPFLSVKSDHYAETFYFKVDRFFDNMDLADTACLIQYTNSGIKDDEGHFYLVPYYDITTLRAENKILLPWMISNSAAVAAGTLTFSFRFYKLDAGKLNDKNEMIYNYIYCLNTKPAKSKILDGLDIMGKDSDNVNIEVDAATALAARIDELSKLVGVYWIEV